MRTLLDVKGTDRKSVLFLFKRRTYVRGRIGRAALLIFSHIKNNLTNFNFYDIIFIENEKRKNLKNFKKSIDNPKIQWYNKEKKEREEKEMTVSRKVEREMIRELFLNKIKMYMVDDEDVDEVLQVKSNEVAIPVVGCEGNEDFVVITVKVPTGANKGMEPYDGYSEAEDYQMKLDEKERKAKEKEEKKKRKIARDEEIRKKKKEIAEKGEQ